MNESGQCLPPESCSRQPRLIEHGNQTFFHHPIGPLYTILLRAISDSVLSLDAMVNAECLKLSRHVLPTFVIIPQSAQLCFSEVLSPSFELLESCKGL